MKVEHERCDFLQHFGGNNQQVLMFGESSGGTVSKNGLLSHLYVKMTIYQDRLGTNIGRRTQQTDSRS